MLVSKQNNGIGYRLAFDKRRKLMGGIIIEVCNLKKAYGDVQDVKGD